MSGAAEERREGEWATWLLFGTVLVPVAAAVLWKCMGHTIAAEFGDLWSAGAGTIAFLWLIAGFYLQRRELSLQREQLTAQKEEMRRMAEQATLGQVSLMLETFNTSLAAHNITVSGQKVSAVQHLPRAITEGNGRAIAEFAAASTGLARFQAWMRWGPLEGVGLQFLGVIVSAGRLYAANSAQIHLQEGAADHAAFIITNLSELKKIAHVELYMLQAEPIARLFDFGRLEHLRMRLAGAEGTKEVGGADILNEGELLKLREEVRKLEAIGGP